MNFDKVYLARVKEKLAELQASFKLCPMWFSKVYSNKLREGLAELDVSSKLCPKKI